MGHNVVIAEAGDMAGVLADGIGAGVANDYVKPGDARIVAHTKLVGGGESTTVSFDPAKLKDGGPYEFFCSFPGHATVMKGSISVG
jgi:azurin